MSFLLPLYFLFAPHTTNYTWANFQANKKLSSGLSSKKLSLYYLKKGGKSRDWTPDPWIMSIILYQLSYWNKLEFWLCLSTVIRIGIHLWCFIALLKHYYGTTYSTYSGDGQAFLFFLYSKVVLCWCIVVSAWYSISEH